MRMRMILMDHRNDTIKLVLNILGIISLVYKSADDEKVSIR